MALHPIILLDNLIQIQRKHVDVKKVKIKKNILLTDRNRVEEFLLIGCVSCSCNLTWSHWIPQSISNVGVIALHVCSAHFMPLCPQPLP